MKRKSYFLIWFILLFYFSFSHASSIRKTFRKSVPFVSNGQIIIDNMNGKIEIDSWNKNEVYIVAEIKVRAPSRRDAEDIMERVEIKIEERGKILEIFSEVPNRRRSRNFLSAFFGRDISISISYRVSVPMISNLDLHTTNGKIDVYDIDGEVDANTSNGSINLEKVKGRVNARTSNGGIVAEVFESNPRDNMELKTSNGSIKLYLDRDIEADIYANTTNGSVRCDFPLDSRDRRSSRYSSRRYTRNRNIRGSINGGGIDIDLRTTNGSISILEL